jgi:hypothetical protein
MSFKFHEDVSLTRRIFISIPYCVHIKYRLTTACCFSKALFYFSLNCCRLYGHLLDACFEKKHLSKLYEAIHIHNKYKVGFPLTDRVGPGINLSTHSIRMRWAGHVARMGEKRNACRILVGKPEGKRPLGRP